jgi:transcriptional regulator with XRE-family HTH domain
MKHFNYHQTLKELLKTERLRLSITQEELSTRLNRHQSYVSKYESGEKKLDIFELLMICDCLEISFVSFIDKLLKEIGYESK